MSGLSSDFSNRDYQVKIGDYFGRGWEIFKQNALQFVLFTLLLVVISALLSQLPSPIGARTSGDTPGLNLAAGILSPILGAGYYFVAFQIARNRPQGFGDFFHGFRKFTPIFLTSFVANILIAIGFVFLILPGIYLAVAYLFAQPFVIDKNLGFWSAMETSRKLITKRWFSFLGLILLLFLLNLAGAIALGVGLLVTIPYSSCIVAAAYEDIVGLNSVAE
ncbi:MAG: hypothetical protein ACFCVD_23685 [Nodosilinea sp.]